MSDINKKSVKRLAELARIELTEAEEAKFTADLEKILGHFKELQGVETANVMPMTGGAELKNVFREDGESVSSLSPDKAVGQFPEKEKHWLKVPPVFGDQNK